MEAIDNGEGTPIGEDEYTGVLEDGDLGYTRDIEEVKEKNQDANKQ